MVGRLNGGRVVCVLLLTLVGIAGILVFLPGRPNGEHAVAIALKSALAAYRLEMGQAPENFVEVLPYLTSVTRADCTITMISANRYDIKINGEVITYLVTLDYRVNADGKMERYDVGDIRGIRNSKPASDGRD